MKKTIIMFMLMIIVYILVGTVTAKNDIIPDEAIRIRVIANSNDKKDQDVKLKVKDTLENKMYYMLKNINDLDTIKKTISSNIEDVETAVNNTLQKENYKLSFTVNFGLNYFPKKEFKGIEYKEGYYESLVVTLGEGLGDNWWCVLFPPLCLIEVSDSADVEYTTMAKTIIDKYFQKK